MWTARIQEGGLASAYTEGSPVNYLPLYLYVLKCYSWIFSADQVWKHLYLLKAVTLLFDFGSIILLCSLVRPYSKRFKYLILGLFNIGFLYNTIVWNQVDGILTFFVFASFYFAMHQRIKLSFLMFVLALNFKLQGIIFLPLLGLLWLPLLKPRNILQMLLIAVITETIILLPYIIYGNVPSILKVMTGSVDYFQFISLNAFNFWHLLLDGNLMKMRDDVKCLGPFTYKQCGLFLFVVSMAWVCIPLYVYVIKKMIKKQFALPDMKTVLLACCLVTCFFFYFNTQMHERYIHPVIIFSTALAMLYKHWAQWFFLSVAYTLNLELVCQYLELPNYGTLIFHPDFIACLYGIGMLQLMYLWYRSGIFKMGS